MLFFLCAVTDTQTVFLIPEQGQYIMTIFVVDDNKIIDIFTEYRIFFLLLLSQCYRRSALRPSSGVYRSG